MTTVQVEPSASVGASAADPVGLSRLISPHDRRRPVTRICLTAIQVLVLVLLVLFCAGPVYWMLKAAVTPTAELTAHPLSLWPSRTRFENLVQAFSTLGIWRPLLNSVFLAVGCTLAQLLVCTTAGFALSVLRPRYGRVLYGAVLATLLVPASIVLVPLYLTVRQMPVFGVNLVGSFWSVWLPAGAQAFGLLLVKRFFDGIPAELYEAARVDGAGPVTLLWRIVLPMSRPVLAVVALFALIGSWKDFLWPLIALPEPQQQPLAVALPVLAQSADQGLLIAALFIASVPPLLLFLVFQRQVVNGVGGFTGSKG